VIRPALREFAPDAIVCAAGTDALQFDPNGRMCLSGAGFHQIGVSLRGVAKELGISALVVTQEGGYARTYGAVGTVATLLGLLGRTNVVDDPIAYLPDEGDAHVAAVAAARAAWNAGAGARRAAR
jgi:acetoin utilization deacetylase AcuC-like enzyme